MVMPCNNKEHAYSFVKWLFTGDSIQVELFLTATAVDINNKGSDVRLPIKFLYAASGSEYEDDGDANKVSLKMPNSEEPVSGEFYTKTMNIGVQSSNPIRHARIIQRSLRKLCGNVWDFPSNGVMFMHRTDRETITAQLPSIFKIDSKHILDGDYFIAVMHNHERRDEIAQKCQQAASVMMRTLN
ncbi:MAG: hypothetical protein CMK92_03380 [Pseudomonas sp.]|nr:hypothetical protein [Pseudomonas sp.]